MEGNVIRAGTDNINGGRGDDFIRLESNRSAPTRVFGETGDDSIVSAGIAGDNLNGGSGNDFYDVRHPDVVVTEGTGGGTSDTVLFTFDTSTYQIDQFIRPANVENFELDLTLSNGVAVSSPLAFARHTLTGLGSFTGTDAAEVYIVRAATDGSDYTTVDTRGGDDQIFSRGLVSVSGGAGDDTIRWSKAVNFNLPEGPVLSGGEGQDEFTFSFERGLRFFGTDYGNLTITDFDGAAGETISIARTNLAPLTVTDTVNGAVVSLTDINGSIKGGTITLTGVSASSFDDGWVI